MAEQHIVIVGSGFSGIGMGIRLKQAGIDDFTIYEQADRVGGTWRDNHYPGAACDIESHLYSFSFEPNPLWTRTFAPQAEILAYLEFCVEKYGLRSHLRLSTSVRRAVFDEEKGVWEVLTSDGKTRSARVIVSGCGGLARPQMPEIPGIDTFAGEMFHSARWNDKAELSGKTVAVIGTGASAIQIVPSIAPLVKHLEVFQRTAPWILPKQDRALKEGEKRWFSQIPALQKLARAGQYLRHEASAVAFIKTPKVLEVLGRLGTLYLKKSVQDPALREKLTPKYTMGCKRVLLSNDYYPAIQRKNVELVTDPIASIRPEGILLQSGELRKVDTIIYATGFQAAEVVAPFEICGRASADLNESWKNGAEAYLGTTVAGFPNLFFIVGPNVGLGHSSMVYMIESQIAYIKSAIETIRGQQIKLVDVRKEAQAAYNAELQSRFPRTVWSSGCVSWYQTRSGKNTTLWPGFTFEFRLKTRKFDPGSYQVVPLELGA